MEFLVAALLTLAATPLMAALARRVGTVDRPGPLKPQTRAVPYLGGLAVLPGLAVGVVVVGRPMLFAPIGLALVLGTVDDVRPLPVRVRLGTEILIGVVGGVVVPGTLLIRIATGLSVVVLLNAMNLLDGQDGLAGSVGLVAALGFAALGGDAEAYGLALAGGLVGFLVFNRPPARIYLGDGGAYLVGVALALAVPLTEHGARDWSVWWAVPLLVGVPIFDTAVAFARRLRGRRPLFQGDRSHVYDQLVDRGMSVARSTMVLASCQIGSTALGVIGARLAPAVALAMTLGVALVSGVGAVRLGLVDASAG